MDPDDAAASRPALPPGDPLRILVADDDLTSRELLAFTLEKLGHEVEQAADGDEAWALFLATKPRLVITDWSMPGIDGAELTRRIRAAQAPHYTHVFMVTGHTGERRVLTGFQAGVDDYVTKPFSAHELRARVAAVARVVRLEDELKALNAAKDRVLGVVAHDLANPLQSVLGAAQLLLQLAQQLTPTERELLEQIVRAAGTMHRLSRDLLDVSAIARGTLRLAPERAPIEPVIRNAVQTVDYQARSKGTELTVGLDAGDLVGWFDPQRIQAALENLLNNAVKYSPAGSTVHVGASRTADGLEVRVADQGPGFTDEDRERLFSEFQRLSARPTGGERSTGLGLAIVHRIVSAHGGRVEVDSPPDGGACFRVTIPAEPPAGD